MVRRFSSPASHISQEGLLLVFLVLHGDRRLLCVNYEPQTRLFIIIKRRPVTGA